MDSALQEYLKKRDFSRSPEPSAPVSGGHGPLVFVVQKHRARQLHYDFRLELDGVLKSWSVPKGPSSDPAEKHLAVMVEDHPLDYASFEGAIPKGEYGAGQVIVWDKGTYSPEAEGDFEFVNRTAAQDRVRQGLERGKLAFSLRGHKLKGSWTLVKMRRGENDWLLMKHRDEYASPGADTLQDERSVLSGRTLDDIKTGRAPADFIPTQLDPGNLPGARLAPFPSGMAPMLAQLAEAPFSHPDWLFEPKLDGYRTLATVHDGKVTLLSRRGLDVTGQYAALEPGLRLQPVSKLVLDGEVVALDGRGRLCFQCLQQYLRSVRPAAGVPESQPPLIYYVFDILYLDGYDLRGAGLSWRKGLLHGIVRQGKEVRLVDYFPADGEVVYRAAVDAGLEGVIAKRIDSAYEPGKRSPSWLKIKAMVNDEFVIGGYTAGEHGRAPTFGSLLLGYFDRLGRLVYAGHVGSGFDGQTLVELRRRLDTLRSDRCPFATPPTDGPPATWVRPELVAEVKFSEWTQDGRLRIPVFLRLRQDKPPEEVRRAEAVSPPPSLSHHGRGNSRTTAGPYGADAMLEQLRTPKDSLTIEVEGRGIKLTNLDKVLWPATTAHEALTKRHLIAYLARVSPCMLSHLKDRPLTLSRYPGGVGGKHFYQKHLSIPMPDFVERVEIREETGGSREYVLCNNLPTLLWLGQLADIELHTWFSRTSPQPDMAGDGGRTDTDHVLDFPDFIIFDIDPFIYSGREPAGAEPELNRQGFASACDVALWLKETLDGLALSSFVKTSGKTGLHVYVPVVRRLDYRAVRAAAGTIGLFLVQKHGAGVTIDWPLEKRTGKVFLDYNQNVRGKTLISAYSPRASAEAAVSTPLTWDEVGKVYPTDFSIITLPDRLERTGDLWAGILDAKRDLKV